MKVLIDGDLVAYRCSAASENEVEDIAIARTDSLIRRLLEETKADTYKGWLGGGDNFRKVIDPNYKANRTAPKPIWLQSCREYLITNWNFSVTDGIEVDDELGIHQVKDFHDPNDPREDTTIVSIDKDLLQIPGKHYRWELTGAVKGKSWIKPAEWHNVSYFQGLLSFYTSSLIGDVSDNIKGVDGIGAKKAQQALERYSTEKELFDKCRAMYNNDARYLCNLSLLWILRSYNTEEFKERLNEKGLI